MPSLRSSIRNKFSPKPNDPSHNRPRPQDYDPEDAYLSYHDIRLLRSDIDTLRSGWLTDNLLAFWEEYLEREYLHHFPTTSIILLRPSMVMMLKQAAKLGGSRGGDSGVLGMKSALPDVRRATHVFLPVNDCEDVELPEGGSHWSLVVMSVRDRISFHYDSMHGSNGRHARTVTTAMQQLIDASRGVYSRTKDGERMPPLSPRVHGDAEGSASREGGVASNGPEMELPPWRYLELPDSPQQNNGSDCGVYVAMIMQHLLLKRVLGARKYETVSMSLGEKEVNPDAGRRDMLDTIEGFKEKAEERQRMEEAKMAEQGIDPFADPPEQQQQPTGLRHKRPNSPPRVDSAVEAQILQEAKSGDKDADKLRHMAEEVVS